MAHGNEFRVQLEAGRGPPGGSCPGTLNLPDGHGASLSAATGSLRPECPARAALAAVTVAACASVCRAALPGATEPEPESGRGH